MTETFEVFLPEDLKRNWLGTRSISERKILGRNFPFWMLFLTVVFHRSLLANFTVTSFSILHVLLPKLQLS